MEDQLLRELKGERTLFILLLLLSSLGVHLTLHFVENADFLTTKNSAAPSGLLLYLLLIIGTLFFQSFRQAHIPLDPAGAARTAQSQEFKRGFLRRVPVDRIFVGGGAIITLLSKKGEPPRPLRTWS